VTPSGVFNNTHLINYLIISLTLTPLQCSFNSTQSLYS